MLCRCLNWKGAVPALAAILMLATGAGTGRAGSPVAQTEPTGTAWLATVRRMPKRNRHNPCQRTSSRPGRRPEPKPAGCGQPRLVSL